MPINEIKYQEIVKALAEKNVTLIAVSKTKPIADIEALSAKGQLDFGENYVQELLEKQPGAGKAVRWHFIGHLQTNKVKLIAPFVHLIHSVDSLKLLKEINKQGEKIGRTINCLLQIYIAKEETKYGLDETELYELLGSVPSLKNVNIKGLMGMATLTDSDNTVRSEYRYLKQLYDKLGKEKAECPSFSILSMGMSGDYHIAIEEGSNMVRIGSLIFGERNYS
jgi:pyridoxal phosphate enzyme (YggS family)